MVAELRKKGMSNEEILELFRETEALDREIMTLDREIEVQKRLIRLFAPLIN